MTIIDDPRYPEILPFASCHLSVSGGHHIYVEQAGQKGGIPVIFLHGGPGSGCNENHRRYFDPRRYHIILFDQRGCNRSYPKGQLADNTTEQILADIDLIRQYLNINKWLLFGGSWGATLALLYGQVYPDRVLGMILRGSFLAREQDLKWFVGYGANRIYPEYWQQLTEALSTNNYIDLIDIIYDSICSDDQQRKLEAAHHWSNWATQVISYSLPEKLEEGGQDNLDLLHQTGIEIHYAKHRYFISENQILSHIERIKNIPGIILHGRRDITCLPEAAWQLSKALPKMRLQFIEDAGHLASDPSMCAALIEATNKMAETLSI